MTGGLPRRSFLAGAACAAVAATGCVRRPPPAAVAPPARADFAVDDTFARLALRHLGGEDLRAELLALPALAAIVRHHHMSGNRGATAEQVLDATLGDPIDIDGAQRVLAYWAGREAELRLRADDALALLPADANLAGSAFLVVGYDIGVAAPPDVLLNAAHPRFIDDPAELGFYLTHEAHHVGFLDRQPIPPMDRLTDPDVLLGMIAFFTRLEGMAVHAAFGPRRAAGRLAGDPDYAVYTDDAFAASVVAAYRATLDQLDAVRPLTAEAMRAALGAMSSGSRLWYRFGALVCRRLEASGGPAAVVASIDDPTRFAAAARELVDRA